MDKTIQNARLRTKEEQEYTRYWANKTSEERIAETWRLSVEKYGPPKSLLDGPFLRIRRNASGEEETIELTHTRTDASQPKQ
jgi:hypothetical protein